MNKTLPKQELILQLLCSLEQNKDRHSQLRVVKEDPIEGIGHQRENSVEVGKLSYKAQLVGCCDFDWLAMKCRNKYMESINLIL